MQLLPEFLFSTATTAGKSCIYQSNQENTYLLIIRLVWVNSFSSAISDRKCYELIQLNKGNNNQEKFYTTMISGEKEFTPKKTWILSKLELQKNWNFSKYSLKHKILIRYPIKKHLNTLLNLKKWHFPFISLNFYRKREWKCDQKGIYDKTQ